MTNQMVCGDSECLTKDMTDGVLSGMTVSGGESAQTVQEIKVQAIAHYGKMMSALDENLFVKITAT